MLQGEKAKKAVCNYSNSFTDTAKIYENQCGKIDKGNIVNGFHVPKHLGTPLGQAWDTSCGFERLQELFE